jgi:hypothetical protein
MRAASLLPHPNILLAERDAREEALPGTRAQKYSTIEMVDSMHVVTPITLLFKHLRQLQPPLPIWS